MCLSFRATCEERVSVVPCSSFGMPRKTTSCIFPFSNRIEPAMQRIFSSIVPSLGAGVDPTAARNSASRLRKHLWLEIKECRRSWMGRCEMAARYASSLSSLLSTGFLRGDLRDRAVPLIRTRQSLQKTREDHKRCAIVNEAALTSSNFVALILLFLAS